MDEQIKKLQDERTQNYLDFYQNIIPKRIPVEMSVSHSVLATQGGLDFTNVQFDFSRMHDIAEDVCRRVYSDRCPIPSGNGTVRIASYFSILNSEAFKMVGTGFIQHPEVSSMSADEYDEFIADPYKFIVDKAIPRVYPALDREKNPNVNEVLTIADKAREEDRAAIAAITREMTEKFGYTTGGGPRGAMGSTETPFDMLADLLRSFTGISTDIRRNRQKILDACEAFYPLCFKLGLAPVSHFTTVVNAPIHMPPFMRPKDMEELYMPTALRMARDYAACGQRFGMFWEANCMQHIDLMQDFPANLQYRFEAGDPKLVKEKLGDKFIVGGFFPIQMLDTASKEEIITELQKLLDIMMPGGGYLFSFDKGLNGNRNINIENMNVVAEYLRDHAVYGSEAGKPWGHKLNEEGFTCDAKALCDIKSERAFSWDEFLRQNPYTPEFARERLQKLYDAQMKYNMALMM